MPRRNPTPPRSKRAAPVRARVGGAEALAALLARAGVPSSRLPSWVRDDLRIAAYVDQRFASAGAAQPTPTWPTRPADITATAGRCRQARPPPTVLRAARERLVPSAARELIPTGWPSCGGALEVVEFRRRTARIARARRAARPGTRGTTARLAASPITT